MEDRPAPHSTKIRRALLRCWTKVRTWNEVSKEQTSSSAEESVQRSAAESLWYAMIMICCELLKRTYTMLTLMLLFPKATIKLRREVVDKTPSSRSFHNGGQDFWIRAKGPK
jgi:hypothetical protein